MQTNETENEGQPETESAELLPEEKLQDKFESINNDLQALSDKHGIDILAAINAKEEKQAGVFYKGTESFVVQAGLAKMIEQKFIQ